MKSIKYLSFASLVILISACGAGGSGSSNLVAPSVEVSPSPITILLPHNVPQSFTISNPNPQSSALNYLVADNGVLGGYLSVTNASGSLSGAMSSTITVSVKPGFVSTGLGSLVGATLMLNVYTPDASNHTQTAVTVHVGENYSISGTVKTSTDSGQPGARMGLRFKGSSGEPDYSQDNMDVFSDADGFYEFTHVKNGTWSVIAATDWQPNDYDFYSRDVTLSTANATGLDFTSHLPIFYGTYQITSTGQVTGTCQVEPELTNNNYSWNGTSPVLIYTAYTDSTNFVMENFYPGGMNNGAITEFWAHSGTTVESLQPGTNIHSLLASEGCIGNIQIQDSSHWIWSTTCTITKPTCPRTCSIADPICWTDNTIVYSVSESAHWIRASLLAE